MGDLDLCCNRHVEEWKALRDVLKSLRPAAQVAVSAYVDDDVFRAPAVPYVYTSEQLEIWTQAAFNNTQVHIALVEEWDEEFKSGDKKVAAVFAFRGTQPWSLSDWLIDFNYDKQPVTWWKDAKPPSTTAPALIVPEAGQLNGVHEPNTKPPADPMAHGGFLYAFNSVAVRPWPLESKDPKFNLGDREKTLDAALLRQIDEYNLLHQEEPEPKELTLSDLTRIICTGHSLGGALATLAAVWSRVALKEHLPAEVIDQLHVSCVTLGSPLVGDKRFAEAFRGLQYHAFKGERPPQKLDCTRIVHAMDPVPMVPPASWG